MAERDRPEWLLPARQVVGAVLRKGALDRCDPVLGDQPMHDVVGINSAQSVAKKLPNTETDALDGVKAAIAVTRPLIGLVTAT